MSDELTELRKRVTELEAKLEENAASYGLVREILLRAPICIEIYDRHGTALWLNQAMVDFLGLPSADIAIGKFNVLQDPFAKEAGLTETFQRAYAGEVVRRELWVDLASAQSKWQSSNRRVCFEELLCPILGPDQRVEAVAAFAVDITERKHADQLLVAAQRQESLSTLAGGIAHDFNNLLTAMLGNASILLAQSSLSQMDRERVETIAQAAEHAAGLTGQLLAYAGRIQISRKTVDLVRLTRELEPLLRVTLPKRVSLSVHTSGDLPLVTVDCTQIRQVLMNLVQNSGEAIGKNEGQVEVRIQQVQLNEPMLAELRGATKLREGTYLRLAVTDSGPGIDPVLLPRIFEPFVTGKAQGHGLGLASVFGIVNRHDGALRVQPTSALGGACIEVFLPASESSLGSARPPTEALVKTPSSLSILVVDDEPSVQYLLGEILRNEGHSVRVVATGEQALDLLAEVGREGSKDQGHFDLIVLDVGLPGMNGNEVLTRIRAQSRQQPVLMSSGHGPPIAQPDPYTAFLPKPYRRVQLLQAITSLVGPQHAKD